MTKNKVTIVQVVYNSKAFIEPVFAAVFNQTFKDYTVVAVISGNDDGSKELLQEKFPRVEIIDPGYNIGFAAGHNLVFERYDSEFFQLVNPDMVMRPEYVEHMLKAFNDPHVGAATGKLYQVNRQQISDGLMGIINDDAHQIIDTTGVTIAKSGRARDRGQHEIDRGQYDGLVDVDGVSGAGCMYRREALIAVGGQKIRKSEDRKNRIGLSDQLNPSDSLGLSEFFDEDFHSYWEDVDLSWRLKNAGWKNVFVPSAVGYHGRGASSSTGGYIHVFDFIKHHTSLSPRIRQLNYRNHILMYIKNSQYFYPQFFVREFFMLLYILLFEISTVKVIPSLIQLIPKMWAKRKAT